MFEPVAKVKRRLKQLQTKEKHKKKKQIKKTEFLKRHKTAHIKCTIQVFKWFYASIMRSNIDVKAIKSDFFFISSAVFKKENKTCSSMCLCSPQKGSRQNRQRTKKKTKNALQKLERRYMEWISRYKMRWVCVYKNQHRFSLKL